MATGKKPPAADRPPWAYRQLARAGRISTGIVTAAALAFTLGLLAVHAATRQGPARTLYIALGDSYSAGDGIPAQFDVRSGCERSSHSYPVLVAGHLGLAASRYRDTSCSSAKIADLMAAQHIGGAVDPPQLSALSADTTLVTLGIGGNDLDFSGILIRCVELDAPGVLISKIFHDSDNHTPCRTSYTSDGTDKIRQKIQATAGALAAALRRIHVLAPHARILVVGYPDLLPASDGSACALTLGITSGDVAYLNDTELQLNRMLASQAAAAGDSYVDTYTPSIGHDSCAGPANRWVEPLLPSAPAAPMHPNAAGQQAIARAVERAVAPAG